MRTGSEIVSRPRMPCELSASDASRHLTSEVRTWFDRRASARERRARMNAEIASPPATEPRHAMPVAHAAVPDAAADEAWDRKRDELRERGVRHCLAAFVDAHGVPKAKAVPIEHFRRMMSGSELFTGAAVDGLGQGPADDELSVRPDLDAVAVLPWEPTVAWAPGCLYFHGEPYPMDARYVLRRQVERAAGLGLVFNLGIETEFFLVQRDELGRPRPANPRDTLPRAAYDVVGLLENLSFMDELVGFMDELGWDVHSFDHEDANSQFELDFSYTDALSMADRFVLWRTMTKALARRHGCEATFMPKPYGDRTGNGGHFNMSLASADSGENLFADDDDPRGAGISELAYRFIAGVLRHAPAICAVT